MKYLEKKFQERLLENSNAILNSTFSTRTADLNNRLISCLLNRDKECAIEALEEMNQHIISSFGEGEAFEDLKTYWTGLAAFIYHSHSLSVKYIDPLMMARTSALTHTLQFNLSLSSLLTAVPWYIDRLFELEYSLNNDSNLIIALDYINENLTEEINIFSLASHINLSPIHLNQIFKKKLNITFKQYLREKRLYRSCQDLTFTTLTIKEIAEKYKYSHQSYYSTHFKDFFGLTPIQYRKRMNT